MPLQRKFTEKFGFDSSVPLAFVNFLLALRSLRPHPAGGLHFPKYP